MILIDFDDYDRFWRSWLILMIMIDFVVYDQFWYDIVEEEIFTCEPEPHQ